MLLLRWVGTAAVPGHPPARTLSLSGLWPRLLRARVCVCVCVCVRAAQAGRSQTQAVAGLPGLASPVPGHRPLLLRGPWYQGPRLGSKAVPGRWLQGGRERCCQLLCILLPISDPQPPRLLGTVPVGGVAGGCGRAGAGPGPGPMLACGQAVAALGSAGNQAPEGLASSRSSVGLLLDRSEKKTSLFPIKTLRRKAGQEGAGEGDLVLHLEAATQQGGSCQPLPGALEHGSKDRQTAWPSGVLGSQVRTRGPGQQWARCVRAAWQGGRRYLTRFSTEYTDM